MIATSTRDFWYQASICAHARCAGVPESRRHLKKTESPIGSRSQRLTVNVCRGAQARRDAELHVSTEAVPTSLSAPSNGNRAHAMPPLTSIRLCAWPHRERSHRLRGDRQDKKTVQRHTDIAQPPTGKRNGRPRTHASSSVIPEEGAWDIATARSENAEGWPGAPPFNRSHDGKACHIHDAPWRKPSSHALERDRTADFHGTC